ncbi:hypothetical protein AAC03nite_06140 [Alicyclobacillus acidoterrestris]|uniref:CheB methylesterase domain-containing protein n=1 Tax=Alicyclobacillus suci TaxID=2816080 RepID=UPI0011902502|nr:CheB methylesterase domain-containing protein [Alicyclobacillus suci]GEO24829.1 hypothetical protein AAC03nite_06140 [Alicyclobacillus acidoterrestris]
MDTAPNTHSSRLRALVVVGTSTGGPKALTELFQALPVMAGVACCVVQHMPAGFTANLAKRLNDSSKWHVSEARDADVIQPGHVYIAPGGMQMRVQAGRPTIGLSIRKEEPVGGHQPSVDVLFHSVLELVGHLQLVGVLLTGMGRDGADGLLKLKDSGAFTVAESERTAVIYGMPKAAVERGAATEVVPLWQIPDVLATHLRHGLD